MCIWRGELARAPVSSTAILAVGPTGILPVECRSQPIRTLLSPGVTGAPSSNLKIIRDSSTTLGMTGKQVLSMSRIQG
jgi:hypothetical protein